MQGSALLAIWSDIAPESETDYLHWLSREHTYERVTTDGFLAARVFRAEGVAARRYLILYELEDAHALGGADYVSKLNNPTPWSQRIMPRLQNFVRGGGPIVAQAGRGEGAFLLPIILDAVPANGETIVETLAGHDRICSVLLMRTDRVRTGVRTREKTMRKKDESFAGLLLIEGLDADAVTAAGVASKAMVPDGGRHPDVFRQVFGLGR